MDAFHPWPRNLDSALTIFDIFAQEAELGLDQSSECRVGLLRATSRNDTQIILVVLGEERMFLEQVGPSLLALENSTGPVDELISSFKLFSHDVQG